MDFPNTRHSGFFNQFIRNFQVCLQELFCERKEKAWQKSRK